MDAILLISHGSRSDKTIEEVDALVKVLRTRTPNSIIEYAFLELQAPSIPEGIDICVQQGATQITVLLNFLNSGRHVDGDIPEIVHEAALKYPAIKFSITKPVGQHQKIADLFIDLINTQ